MRTDSRSRIVVVVDPSPFSPSFPFCFLSAATPNIINLRQTMVTKKRRSALHRTCNVVTSDPFLSQLHFFQQAHEASPLFNGAILASSFPVARECCPGESPLLHIAFVRIHGGASLVAKRSLTFAFLLFSRIFQIYCDCLLRLCMPYTSAIASFVRSRRQSSSSSSSSRSRILRDPRIFQCEIIMMLYIVIHSLGGSSRST
jgi:hypothetical protein